MGTRADFYTEMEGELEWLGSIAWDGDPNGLRHDGYNEGKGDYGKALLSAGSADEYRAAVDNFLSTRDDATVPGEGWPWPWDSSSTTDYAYVYRPDDRNPRFSPFGMVDVYEFGEPFHDMAEPQAWPDMSPHKQVTFGKRSGLIVIEAGEEL